jgi:ribosomal protein S18 acetylase RimI-like enzyme
MLAPFGGSSIEDAGRSRLSQRLWNLDWNRHLPWRFDDVTVELGTFADAVPFMAAHYPAIFHARENEGRFLGDPMTPAKRRFCDEMDVFLLKANGALVGLWMGHPTDWSTYYGRNSAILPEYRNRHLVTRLMDAACKPLSDAGVERFEAECAPSNVASVKLLVALGFVITSTSTTDRWGAMLRFTKFLRKEAEEVFARQYCALQLKASRPHP